MVGERVGRGGTLVLWKYNTELEDVRGLDETEGDCVGEFERGLVVNRGDCVCMGRIDGVTKAAGYGVPELVGPEYATVKVGDRGRVKLKEEPTSWSSSWMSDDAFSTSTTFSSAAQLNPRPIEVTPQLFPTLAVRLLASLVGGAPQLSSSKVISTAAGAVSIE